MKVKPSNWRTTACGCPKASIGCAARSCVSTAAAPAHARFEIYRNGEKIGVLGGARVKRWNPDGHDHAWNYSDQPLAGCDLPALRFEDAGAPVGARHEVVTVNCAGFASTRAAAQ